MGSRETFLSTLCHQYCLVGPRWVGAVSLLGRIRSPIALEAKLMSVLWIFFLTSRPMGGFIRPNRLAAPALPWPNPPSRRDQTCPGPRSDPEVKKRRRFVRSFGRNLRRYLRRAFSNFRCALGFSFGATFLSLILFPAYFKSAAKVSDVGTVSGFLVLAQTCMGAGSEWKSAALNTCSATYCLCVS